MHRAVVVTLLLPHVAHAEFDVGADLSAGIVKTNNDGMLAALAALEAAWQPNDDSFVRWRLHAGFGQTTFIDSSPPRDALDLRAGIEFRSPRCRPICAYFDGDLGYFEASARDDQYVTSFTGALALLRVGSDAGFEHVRFRIGLEFPVGIVRERHFVLGEVGTTSSGNELAYGLFLTTGIHGTW